MYEFPQRLIGGKQRRFQTSWFDKYQWLHYDSCTGAAFCYICVRDHFSNPISPGKILSAFTTTGFTKWIKATAKDGFRSHDISQAHTEATLRALKIPIECSNFPTRSECVDRYFQPSTYPFPESNEQIFRRIYFEALDNAIQTIKARFDQADWVVYKTIHKVFLNSLKGEPFQEYLDVVMDTFCDSINREELVVQLITLKFYPDEPIIDAKELVKFLQGLTAAKRCLMPQILILAQLLLVMPATNAVSERSFSALKRVKTNLRATTKEKRFNHVMILHVHKDRTDKLDLVDVANRFVEWIDNRVHIFGKFTCNGIKPKGQMKSLSLQTS